MKTILLCLMLACPSLADAAPELQTIAGGMGNDTLGSGPGSDPLDDAAFDPLAKERAMSRATRNLDFDFTIRPSMDTRGNFKATYAIN